MGKRAIAFLQPGWADWEAGHVLPLLREHFGVEVRTATPDGGPQVSIGGLEARADTHFAEVKPADADIFLAIGSDAWPGFHDERFFALLREALDQDRIVGVICAATVAGARAGLFEGRDHTSNGKDWLLGHAPGYAGVERYCESGPAVADGRLVSAPGRAPNTFAIEIARLVRPEAAKGLAEYEVESRREWAELK